MSTVSPAPLLLSLVHLNMRHIERIDIQALNLQEEKNTLNNHAVYKESSHNEAKVTYFSIALCILEKIQNEFSRLGRPTSLTIRVARLSLRCTSNTTTVPTEGNGLLVGNHILKIPFSLAKLQLPDGKSCLTCVLNKMSAKLLPTCIQ